MLSLQLDVDKHQYFMETIDLGILPQVRGIVNFVGSVRHFLNDDECWIQDESLRDSEEMCCTILTDVCDCQASAISHREVCTLSLGAFHEEFDIEVSVFVWPVERNSLLMTQLKATQ